MTADPHALRDALGTLVGWTGLPQTVSAQPLSTQTHDWGVVEELVLAGTIPGTLVRPKTPGPHPAVLYCHAHGFAYHRGRAELLSGSKSLASPWGPALAERGFVSLGIDMPGFGDRRGEGSETALAKAYHWRGGTLFGAMLSDLAKGIAHLCEHPEVEANAIYTLGLSMGATHAMWLGALCEELRGVVQLCVLSDIAPLIEDGTHDLHAPYLTVPGLLKIADIGDVAALVAPRMQFVGLGATDPLTPEPARTPALARLREAYASAPDRLTIHLEPHSGHVETGAMRTAAIAALRTDAAPAIVSSHRRFR